MKLKKSSNKSFGILFFLVFFLIGLWPLLNGENIRVWAIILSLIFLLLGLFDSKILSPLNNSWIRLGEVLGRIIAPLVMALIYFVILTPLDKLHYDQEVTWKSHGINYIEFNL